MKVVWKEGKRSREKKIGQERIQILGGDTEKGADRAESQEA